MIHPPAITVSHVSKTFGGGSHAHILALDNVSFEIHEGEFFLMVGPSGCGKSTLLRIMSGLDKDYSGTVKFHEGFFHKDIGFVFQQFALLPWMTVEQNVEMSLLARKIPEDERKPAVAAELRRFGLEQFATAYPRELSGGMRQRVGIARALVMNPKILFLDEPFSELDSFVATALRRDLLEIWKERKLTVVMVSHIVPEAIELGSRIAVMSSRPGRLEKIIVNNLPRPREKRSEEFFDMEDQLYSLIKP